MVSIKSVLCQDQRRFTSSMSDLKKFKGLNFKIHSLTLNQSATVYLQFVQIRLRNLLTKQQTCLTEKIS